MKEEDYKALYPLSLKLLEAAIEFLQTGSQRAKVNLGKAATEYNKQVKKRGK